jgi:hypothetical protein
MVIGEYKYAVNQHVKSFYDRPSKEFDVFFLKLTMMSATCPECDMEFSRKDALLRHKKIGMEQLNHIHKALMRIHRAVKHIHHHHKLFYNIRSP